MANTVSILSYANTFGDWLVATNAIGREHNDLVANNWTKSTGTMYLSDPTLGLQVATGAIFAGTLQVQGTGSSAFVQNNARVDGTIQATNTSNAIYSTGQITSLARINANTTGLGLYVSNNATIGQTANANNLFVTSLATLGNLQTQFVTTTNELTVNTTSTLTGVTRVSGVLIGENTLYINRIQANNGVIATGPLVANGSSFLNIVQANTSVNTANVWATNTIVGKDIKSNNGINSVTLSVSGNGYFGNIASNAAISTTTFTSNTISAYSIAVGVGGVTVDGNFTINGTTVYNTPNFIISALANNQTSTFGTYRATSNAALKWDEANTDWYMARGGSANNYYYKLLTTQYLQDGLTDTSSANVASAKAANTLQNNIVTANTSLKSYVDNANTSMKSYVDTANTSLKSYVDNTVSTANTSLKSYVDNNITVLNGVDTTQNTNITTANNAAWAGYARANTSSNTFTGTSGTATPNTGVISFYGSNGVTLAATSNTITVSTPQDLQTNAAPSFAGLTLTGRPTSPTPTTNTSNTMIATTAFVQNQLNNGNVYQHTANVANFQVVVDDTTTNATMYPVWVTTTGANVALKTSTTNLYFNPSTGSMSATIFNSLSDENRKENIVRITDATAVVKQIQGVEFTWKDNGKKSYGHIAQRIEEILPDLVDTNEEGVKSINYNGIIAFLVETVKEMDKRITELEKK